MRRPRAAPALSRSAVSWHPRGHVVGIAVTGQAAVVGWISSNDVALFTTVLFMAIAIYLHARYSKGAKENVQITEANASLATEREAAGSEIDAFQD